MLEIDFINKELIDVMAKNFPEFYFYKLKIKIE